MKYLYIFGTIAIILVSVFIIFKPKQEVVVADQTPTPTPKIVTTLPTSGDKIEVFLFHATQRCISCINIGKFTKSVVDEKFSQELSTGKIIFKEINIDLAENRQIAKDYGVSGSSLFITVTKDGQMFKEEDTDVWRYVPYETKFKNYFEAKLKYLL